MVKQSFYIPKINLSMVSSPGHRMWETGWTPMDFVRGLGPFGALEFMASNDRSEGKQLKSPNDSRGCWWITQWLQRLLMNHLPFFAGEYVGFQRWSSDFGDWWRKVEERIPHCHVACIPTFIHVFGKGTLPLRTIQAFRKCCFWW